MMARTRGPESRLAAGGVPRHRHDAPYAAIVLTGGYLEAGDAGRYRVEPGDVLVHGRFEAHANRIAAGGSWVVNLPLDPDHHLPSAFRSSDVDAVLELARSDLRAAAGLLTPAEVLSPMVSDWPDLLALTLMERPDTRIGRWAVEQGLTAPMVSRGFRSVFGVTPARFRLEARTRAALADLGAARETLAAIAHKHGFADQAHFSRAVSAITGLTPRMLRGGKSVQDGSEADPLA